MSDIVEEIKKFITEINVNQAEAADLLGISQPYLSQILSGKKVPDTATEHLVGGNIATARKFRLLSNPEYQSNARFAGLEAEGFRRVPIISWAKAGEATDYDDLQNHIDDWTITQTKDKNAYALIVEGDSMEPEYRPGDLVVCAPNSMPRNGHEVVARLRNEFVSAPNSGGVLLKRYYQGGPNGTLIRLESNNSNYKTLEHQHSDFWFIHPVATLIRIKRPA